MDKSEMKRSYKQSNRSMGVYKISISQDGKVYIGYATDLDARWNRHRTELRLKSHRNKELQKIWDSYGESVFEFEILDVLDQEENTQSNSDEELRLLAEMWTQKLKQAGADIVPL